MSQPVDLFSLVLNVDEELIKQGVEPHRRPLAACKRIAGKLGIAFTLGGNRDRFVDHVHEIYAKLYKESDLRGPPIHVGVCMFRDVFWAIKVPLIYGAPRINPVDFLSDATPFQKQWLFGDKSAGLTFFDQFIDIFDFALGLMDMSPAPTLAPKAIEFWNLGKQQLEAAASSMLGSFDKYVVVQNCSIAAELFLKGGLLRAGKVTEAELKSKYGHKLDRLADEFAVAHPKANGPLIRKVAGRFPGLVESRYEMRAYSRIELGNIMMDAQFVAAEIVRQFSARNLRADIAASPDPDWDVSNRTYPA